MKTGEGIRGTNEEKDSFAVFSYTLIVTLTTWLSVTYSNTSESNIIILKIERERKNVCVTVTDSVSLGGMKAGETHISYKTHYFKQ